MYAALWRILPGPSWVKAVQSLILFAGFVALCFLWLFPKISDRMPFSDVTVDGTGQSVSEPTTSITAPAASSPAARPSSTATP